MSVGVLSTEQMRVWDMRAAGYHYDQIISTIKWIREEDDSEISLSGHRALCTCLKRTSLEQRWEPKVKTNHIVYLSNTDLLEFQNLIEERADDLCCVYTFEAKDLAYSLHQRRIQSAIEKLHFVKCPDLARKIEKKYLNLEPP
jgi:hypothetical protein